MSEIKQVYWKRGYRSKLDPEKAFKELERIKARNGGTLTAGLIVFEAKKKRNYLHSEFEWDLTKAAEEHWLEQARKMLRSVVVTYKDSPEIQATRQYVVVTEPPKSDAPERKVYTSMAEALQDPVMHDEILGNAIRDAIAYRRKYAALSELAKVFHAIGDFVESQSL